jgi:hypothetical protein
MIIQQLEDGEELEDIEEDDDEEDYLPEVKGVSSKNFDINNFLPITPSIVEDVSLFANFECWIGHTNFDITNKIKEQLNQIPGIEILKILSRYRFFVGIGEMFDFQDVRHFVENELIKGDIENE